MKVMVFAIDGLEADLVKKWNLKGFMQKYHGKHDVVLAKLPDDPIYTPLIWAAFLLGKPGYLYGFDFNEILKRRIQLGYRIPRVIAELRVRLFGKRNLHLRYFFAKIGIFQMSRITNSAYKVENLPKNAFKDALPEVAKKLGYRVWIKEFPSYNDRQRAKLRGDISSVIFDKDSDILRREDFLTEKLFNEAMKSINSHDLILYYTDLIDLANHRLYRPGDIKSMTILASYYKKIEKLVTNTVKSFNDLAVMVVSDHGFDPIKQEHSDHGFWSLNIKPPRIPQTILDFKDIILELLTL